MYSDCVLVRAYHRDTAATLTGAEKLGIKHLIKGLLPRLSASTEAGKQLLLLCKRIRRYEEISVTMTHVYMRWWSHMCECGERQVDDDGAPAVF